MNKTITLLILGVIFLALLLMVLNTVTREEVRTLPTAPPETTRSQTDRSLARSPAVDVAPPLVPAVPEARSSEIVTPPALSAAPMPAERAVLEPPSVAVKTVPAQIDAGQAAQTVPPPQTTAPAPPPALKVPAVPESNARQKGAKNITSIVVYATQEGATLRLGADALLECTSMLLRSPERLVLDCAGHWNVKNTPGVPQNKSIKAVRIGQQADGTRFVIDLHRAPAAYRLIQTSPQGIDLRLR